ncbi:cytochrome aa3 quinol oxidase subunit IV [Alicyclobacillaceae bacterium I2511]|nr:cytochrome aa3 quinol oxidase subunit IV [Alicyclobacillaceae bacterium I2511]
MSIASPTNTSHGSYEKFPWKHILGFVLSLALTFIALWLVLSIHMPPRILITLLVFLAILQVFVQFLFFMHIGEGYRPGYHISMILFAFFTVFVVVAASIWIMSFASMPSMVS